MTPEGGGGPVSPPGKRGQAKAYVERTNKQGGGGQQSKKGAGKPEHREAREAPG